MHLLASYCTDVALQQPWSNELWYKRKLLSHIYTYTAWHTPFLSPKAVLLQRRHNPDMSYISMGGGDCGFFCPAYDVYANQSTSGSNRPQAHARAKYHVPNASPSPMMMQNGSHVFTAPHQLTCLPLKNTMVACMHACAG